MNLVADRIFQMIEHLREGIVLISHEGLVSYLNPSAVALLNIRHSNWTGRHVSEVIRNARLQRFISKIPRDPTDQSIEIVIDTESGERAVSVYGALLGGVSSDIMLCLSDHTRIRKLEKVKTDFIANVSHELKTPVTIIQGAVETLLESKEIDSENRDKFLASIGRQTVRLTSLFRDVLALSRLEQDGDVASVSMELRSLRPILEECIIDNTSVVNEKGIALSLECDESLMVRANVSLLSQAVQNLIQNAVEYTPCGGQIFLSARADCSGIMLSVRDTGCGIAAEHLSRIFERFYRVERSRSRKFGGTGLGLSIVKHIAQVHGGSVSVKSVVGEGSEFSLQLKAGSV